MTPRPVPGKVRGMNKALQAHQFKGLSDWVEVFRAGTHTDSKGRSCTFSAGDLAQMASNHAAGAAPAVIGHPKDTDPAYAWVDGYKVDGDSLYAKFSQINPAFEAGVSSGAYRNRSVSVFKDSDKGWRVRHVGWLGAVPPAIDGLSPVEFAADVLEEACFEFSAPGYSLVWGLESVAQLLRNLREQMIAKDGLEAANTALPQYQIDSALASAAQARQEFQQEQAQERVDETHATPHPQFSKPTPTGGDMSFTQEQLDAAAAQAAKAAEEKSRADFAAQAAELLQLRSERQAERIGAQITGWTAQGLVTPADEAGLAEFMGSLENAGGEFSFSASDKTPAKKTPAQFFADFMAARKPLVKLGGLLADPKEDTALDQADSRAIATAAQDYQAAEHKAGRVIPIESAVAHVMQRGK